MRWSFDELAIAASLAIVGLIACIARWREGQLAAAQRRRAEAQEAAALLGIVPDPAMALDADGRVTLANPAAMRLLDSGLYAGGERSLARLLCCPALDQWLAGVGAAGSTATETLEIEINGPAYAHRWYRVAAPAIGPSEAR